MLKKDKISWRLEQNDRGWKVKIFEQNQKNSWIAKNYCVWMQGSHPWQMHIQHSIRCNRNRKYLTKPHPKRGPHYFGSQRPTAKAHQRCCNHHTTAKFNRRTATGREIRFASKLIQSQNLLTQKVETVHSDHQFVCPESGLVRKLFHLIVRSVWLGQQDP